MDDERTEPDASEQLYDVHPLDRDYSSLDQPPRIPAIEFDVRVRRIGAVIFGAGFVTVFVAAILLGNVGGGGLLASIASGFHRAGMILILIGGVVIVVAYRLPQWKQRSLGLPHGLLKRNVAESYSALVGWNAVAFVVIAPAEYLLLQISSPLVYWLVFHGTLTLASAFLATIVVWHGGFIRAYGIGVLVSLLLQGNNPFMYSIAGWGVSPAARFLPAISLAITLICGLVCGGYVCWLEAARSQRADRP